MSRCELTINRDMAIGNNKSGKEVKGAKGQIWYSRRYRAMLKAVEHTIQGKNSSEEYMAMATAKRSRKAKSRTASAGTSTPMTDKMRATHPKRKYSSTETKSDAEEREVSEECKKRLKLMTEKLDTITELYKGSKAMLTVAEMNLEKEREAIREERATIEAKLKHCEEKHKQIWADRTKEYKAMVTTKLAAFDMEDAERLISPALGILETGKMPRHVNKDGKIVDIEDEDDEDAPQEMDEDDNVERDNKNDISVEETAEQGDHEETICSLNSLALATPQRTSGDQVTTIKDITLNEQILNSIPAGIERRRIKPNEGKDLTNSDGNDLEIKYVQFCYMRKIVNKFNCILSDNNYYSDLNYGQNTPPLLLV